jgi:hypothetical protein
VSSDGTVRRRGQLLASAALSSFASSSASVSISCEICLFCALMAAGDLVGHVRGVDGDQAGLAVVQDLPEAAQIVVAHTTLDVAGHSADRGTGGGAASQADEPDPRQQHAGGTHGQAPAHPGRSAVTGRLLMLFHHPDLAVLVAVDYGGVEVVRRLHVVVQRLDRLVVGLCRIHVVVCGRENQHRVLLAHALLPSRSAPESGKHPAPALAG